MSLQEVAHSKADSILGKSLLHSSNLETFRLQAVSRQTLLVLSPRIQLKEVKIHSKSVQARILVANKMPILFHKKVINKSGLILEGLRSNRPNHQNKIKEHRTVSILVVHQLKDRHLVVWQSQRKLQKLPHHLKQ